MRRPANAKRLLKHRFLLPISLITSKLVFKLTTGTFFTLESSLSNSFPSLPSGVESLSKSSAVNKAIAVKRGCTYIFRHSSVLVLLHLRCPLCGGFLSPFHVTQWMHSELCDRPFKSCAEYREQGWPICHEVLEVHGRDCAGIDSSIAP